MTRAHTPPTTIDRLLEWWSDHHPDQLAHVVPTVGTMTYAQWQQRTLAVAEGLRRRAVASRTHVALSFPRERIMDFAVCLTAVHRLGAVAVLMPADESAEGLTRLIDAGRPELLVTPRASVGHPRGTAVPTVSLEDVEGPVPAVLKPAAADPLEAATVVFTSGTTGQPKAVAMRHGDITFQLEDRWERLIGGELDGTLLHSFPLSVPVGQWAAQVPLLRALRSVTMTEFNPSAFLDLIETYQVTETAVVPATAVALRDLAAQRRTRTTSVKRVTIGSARCPVPALRTVRELFADATVVIDYSSTESGWAGTATEYGDQHTPGAVGRPHDGCAVRIVDDNDLPLPTGQTGNVELMLPPGIPPRFYLDDPTATAATFRDRWIRMADLGHLDEDGCLHLTARTNDIVNLSGRKVSCPEVERVFENYRGVREAAAFPFDDPVLGEELGVAVVVADPAVDVGELRRHAAEHLSSHKVPSRITILATLPRTRSGKVRKAELATLTRFDEPPGNGNVRGLLLRAVHDILGTSTVSLTRSLTDLGASSVEVIRIYNRVTESADVEFDLSMLFDPLPLTELAERISAAREAV